MFGAAAEKSEVTILPKASQGELGEICCNLHNQHTKYTNTIHKYTKTTSFKVADMPNMLYFLKGNKAEAHKFQDGKRRIRTVYFV